jgi:hypothetical protein
VAEEPKGGWTVETLLELMNERDKRYEQRFQAQEKAISKTEADSGTKSANTNEWRQAMQDRETTLAKKVELVPMNEQLRKCITTPGAFAMIAAIGTVVFVLKTILDFAIFVHK